LKTPEEMEQLLGLPSLGAIPTMTGPRHVGRACWLHATIRTNRSPKSARIGRRDSGMKRIGSGQPSCFRIRAAPKGRHGRVLVPAEGKTTTVALPGLSWLRPGRTFIDHMRKRRTHFPQRQPDQRYLSGGDLFSDPADELPESFLLPAGFRPNPAELIRSGHGERLRLLGITHTS
jgi:hypothetical protein